MEEEKFLMIGKELGYAGKELELFIDKKVSELREREERAKERELKQLEIQAKLKEKDLELARINAGKVQNEDKGRRVPKLPNFNENIDDMSSFIHRFELFATNQGWKKETWSMSLQSLLTGRALQVLSHLSVENANNYDTLKNSLLNAFRCTDEGFRQRFREAKPLATESFTAFVNRSKLYMSRWIELSNIDLSNGRDVSDLMLRDQILNTCNAKLSSYLREQKPKNSDEMSKLAENYIAAHPDLTIMSNKNANDDVYCPGNVATNEGQDRGRPRVRSHFRTTPPGDRRSVSLPPVRRDMGRSRKPLTCFICKKVGHVSTQCFFKNHQDGKRENKPTCQICNKYGHSALTCKQRNSNNAMPFSQDAQKAS